MAAELKAMFAGDSTGLQLTCVTTLYLNGTMDYICRETPDSSCFTVRVLQKVTWSVQNLI